MRGREITFTTIYNLKAMHHVIPYELTHGSEEKFNYLLGQEYSRTLKRNMAVSYRLCRIKRPSYDLSSGTLEAPVRDNLEKSKKNSPQYAINEDAETCVRLSEKGQQSFKSIYFGRPVPKRSEKQKDGSSLHYFKSSLDQLYRYFVRFNAGEAEVLYPEQLRERLRRFYVNALKVYRKHSAAEKDGY